MTVTNNRISDSVRVFPQRNRCFLSMSSHRSNASYNRFTSCKERQIIKMLESNFNYNIDKKIAKLRYHIISFLICSKPTFINTVVYPIVNPFVSLIDYGSEVGWIKIERRVFCNMIELGVEHSEYLRALIVNYSLKLLIPKNLPKTKKPTISLKIRKCLVT